MRVFTIDAGVRIKRGTCVRDFIMCQAMLAFLL
jgi:hypothetical protein